MMRIIFFALVLIPINLAATTSPLPSSVRLWYYSIPVVTHGPELLGTMKITVYAKGLATVDRCPVNATGCTTSFLTLFTESEMAQIEARIEEARVGSILTEDPGTIHCMLIPIHRVHYTADNGEILLYSAASPCGHWKKNDSAAADQLLDLLNELEARVVEAIPLSWAN